MNKVLEGKESALGIEFFSAMFDEFVEAVVACDSFGEMRYFNRMAATLHGLDESALAKGVLPSRYDLLQSDGVTPYDFENSPLLQALRHGAVHDLQFSIKPKNGRPIITVLARGKRLVSGSGETLGAMLIMSDISAQAAVARQRHAKIADAARDKVRQEYADRPEQSENEYRNLVDISPQVVWKARPDGHITYFNDYWYRLTECSPEESLGRHYLSMVHPDDRAGMISVWQSSMAKREAFEAEVRIVSAPDQTFNWFLIRAVPEFDGNNEIHHWVGTGIDISSRKATERMLRSHVQMLEQLNHVSASVASELRLEPLMQVVTDAAVQATNAQFGAFFHTARNAEGAEYSLYAISGVPRELFSKFPMPRATAVFGPTFSGQSKRSDDITADPAFGKNSPNKGMPAGHLPVRSYLAVPVFGQKGEVYGAIFLGHANPSMFSEQDEGMVKSIAMQASIGIVNSRLYEMTESLLEAERLARSLAEREGQIKEEFLATVSHELRTPLNAIVGWSGMLAQRFSEDPALGKALAVIERNARAQTRIIDDLLTMSTVRTGKLDLHVAAVDLRRILREAVDNLKPASDAKSIRIVTDFGTDAAMVKGDTLRLHQVFWNLLSNALKFSQRDTQVQVSIAYKDAAFEVSILDQGRGITPEFMPYLFDRFRQEDGSITRQHGGLGLGLAIARSLVEQHGGQIFAYSDGVGTGAKFVVSLPEFNAASLPDSSTTRIERSPVQPAEGDLLGMKIMVVDDDDDVLLYLREMLTGAGAIVATAASVRIALDLIAKDRPDLLLSDIVLPVEGGLDLIHRLRTQETEAGTPRLPAVAMTGMTEYIHQTHVLRAGFDAFVGKPMEASVLIDVIGSLVGNNAVGAV